MGNLESKNKEQYSFLFYYENFDSKKNESNSDCGFCEIFFSLLKKFVSEKIPLTKEIGEYLKQDFDSYKEIKFIPDNKGNLPFKKEWIKKLEDDLWFLDAKFEIADKNSEFVENLFSCFNENDSNRQKICEIVNESSEKPAVKITKLQKIESNLILNSEIFKTYDDFKNSVLEKVKLQEASIVDDLFFSDNTKYESSAQEDSEKLEQAKKELDDFLKTELKNLEERFIEKYEKILFDFR